MERTQIPIGVTDFGKIIRNPFLFCDKTAMIADFLGRGEEVTLITRPRRWGKTLTLSMFQHFLAPVANGNPTSGLFEGLDISRIHDGQYMQHQGQSPVILISFKDVREQTLEKVIEKTRELFARVFREFREILTKSNRLSSDLIERFNLVLHGTANPSQLEDSLRLLSECLYIHYQKTVYILIDEYDTPLNAAYIAGCLDDVVPFFRALLGSALKDNPSLNRGVLTGILRIARDSVFSGLNNLKICTVMDDTYKSYFGFTEVEVEKLFKAKKIESKLSDAKRWYNGYLIGDSELGSATLYNPWSIISCLDNKGLCKLYWISTANNDLIQKAILEMSMKVDESLTQLIKGQSVEVLVNPFIQFDELAKDEKSFWGLLLSAGYLTAESSAIVEKRIHQRCRLRIPNEEILSLFYEYTQRWLEDHLGVQLYTKLIEGFLNGKVEQWVDALSSFLKEMASFFDLSHNQQGESFYHAFCLGLVTQLYLSHRVRSNQETGTGRCDLLIVPKTRDHSIAWVIEFKYASKQDDLKSEAQSALNQIQHHEYGKDLQNEPNVKKIFQVGIAFSGKELAFVSNVIDVIQ